MKILLWPFHMIWLFIGSILNLTGRLVAAILGFVFIMVGIILIITVIGSFVGIPLVILGFLLLVRAMF